MGRAAGDPDFAKAPRTERLDATAGVDARDVLIAGAGLVGLALAAALAQRGLRVWLLDRGEAETASAAEGWDSRIYAISPGSAAFLEAVGAWQKLPAQRVEAVESMRIVGDSGATLDFSAYELGERALAWIVEERALRAALLEAARVPGIDFVTGARFASLTWSATEGALALDDGRRFSARLVVGADGLHSWVRKAAGIVAIGSGGPYAQAAARALLDNTPLPAREIVERSLRIAGEICIYTNQQIVMETLEA